MSQYKKGWVKNDDTFNKVGKLTFSSKNQAICDMQKNDINALILWTVLGTFSGCALNLIFYYRPEFVKKFGFKVRLVAKLE